MKSVGRIIVVIISIVIILAGTWFMTREPRVDPTLSSLLQLDGIRKNTGDVLNETGVKSVDDIKFKVKEKKIEFYYGKHLFYVAKDDINTKEFQEKFAKLGLDVKLGNNGNVIVKYDKQLVKEIV